jgi:Ca-activated chloride channel family protein
VASAALGGERSYVFPAALKEAQPAPTLLDLEVAMVSDQPITTATSLNHPDARLDHPAPGQWIARLHRAHEGLERDLALRWQQDANSLDLAARAVRVKKGEPAYVEARIAFNSDPVPLLHQPIDVVMVVDTSLSMAGEPLERARKLAEGVLSGLTSDDKVNLVTFNDEVNTLHGGMVPARGAMLAMTRDAVSKFRAHGRSNLEAALDEAAQLLAKSERGLVVLMTDGQPTVGELYEGGAAKRKDFDKTRVLVAHFNYPSRRSALEALFPSVSTRYVPDGPAGDDAVAELTRLAVAPMIEQLEVKLAGGEVDHIEGVVPTHLAVGESLRLMARAGSDVLLHVSGTLHDRPFALDQRVAVPADPDGRGDRGLPVEWARMRVRNLESKLDAGAGDKVPELTKEIRALGKDYGLMTRFTSFVVTDDSLSPDRIKPGDPEIRIRAPRSALGVRAVLPWGEIVECAWQPDEELWLGRFLVPRGVADGMYRVRVFVDGQGGTVLRGTLFFQVDSKPPTFVLSRDGDKLIARVKDGVFDRSGDAIVRDRIDLKHIVVQLAGRELPMARVGDSEVWEVALPGDLPAGKHVAHLYTTDFASNTSETTLAVELR